MTRAVATTRTAASARSTALAHTAQIAYRVPIDILNLGVTQLWDFRTGYTGQKKASIQDMVGKFPMYWKGTTAVSSIYTTGFYQVNLERSNSDYFKSVAGPIVWTGANMTLFMWVKRESIGSVQNLLTHWETTISQRGFKLQVLAANTIDMQMSNNGVTTCNYTTSATFTNTSAWHFIVFTYDTINRAVLYIDNVSVAMPLTAGTNPAIINGGPVEILIGAQTPSTPTSFYDGLFGICGMAVGTAMTSAQASTLYNITNRIGRYV